jgi:6-pyruvoyltetrahydropterin/6-carboxytetrahydropterin synthase
MAAEEVAAAPAAGTVYTITKRLTFCYGHRLLNYEGKCRFLHGHNASVDITFRAGTLDRRGMVADFGEIKAAVKGWLDSEIDHTLLLCREDPLVPVLEAAGERVTLVDWNPTAENIARMIYEYVERKGFPVVEVTVWETESAFARFSR